MSGVLKLRVFNNREYSDSPRLHQTFIPGNSLLWPERGTPAALEGRFRSSATFHR